ncbi:MAG: aminotransferase class IV [Clostridia bacterium]
MKNLAFYNGKITEIEQGTIPINDRACYFGDGVYDATYTRHGFPFAIGEHVDRFVANAHSVGIEMQFDKAYLCGLLVELCARVDGEDNFVYWQVSRGSGIREHCLDKKAPSNLLIMIYPKALTTFDKRYALCLYQDIRYYLCNVKTLNLLPNVLASQFAKEYGCDECILHRQGMVTEGAHSNISYIKNNLLISPPNNELILRGIAREHLFAVARQLDLEVVQREFYIGEILDADEIIVTSSGTLCASAQSVDRLAVGGKQPETIRKLQRLLLDEFEDMTSGRKMF